MNPSSHENFLRTPLLVLVARMKFLLNERVRTVFLKVEKYWTTIIPTGRRILLQQSKRKGGNDV